MEGLGLPVFKLLQKTPSAKDNKREQFLQLLRQGRGRGGPKTSTHLPPARQLSSGWTARGLTPVPSPTSSFGRLAAWASWKACLYPL